MPGEAFSAGLGTAREHDGVGERRQGGPFLALYGYRRIVMITETAGQIIHQRLEPAREAVETRVREARRVVTRARNAAEDFADDASLRIRRHPLSAVAAVASAGLLVGYLAGVARERCRPKVTR